LRGAHIEGYIASCDDKEGLTTDDIIAGIGDPGPSGVLHGDGYLFGEDVRRTAWVRIRTGDADHDGYREGALIVGNK
jgi:hypothetical protein